MYEPEVKKTKSRRFSEQGATVVEYAIMLSLIIALCYIALRDIGTTTNTNFTPVDSALN